MFEHRSLPLLPPLRFVLRLIRTFGIAAAVVLSSLGIGTLGYHGFEKLPWIDALLNAAMILTGMGPVDRVQTAGGKLFAAAYALFSGVVFLTTAAIMLAPVFHRIIHRFHLDIDGRELGHAARHGHRETLDQTPPSGPQ